jgi:hypothetical protein
MEVQDQAAEPRTISREEIKEVLEQIRSLPDFSRLALPANIHKEFQIPMEGYGMRTMEAFYSAYSAALLSGGAKGENRPPLLDASGRPIIRPLLQSEPVPIEVVTCPIAEIDDETFAEPDRTSSPSTEASSSAHQESQVCSSSLVPDGE